MDRYQELLYSGFPRDGARPIEPGHITRLSLFNEHHFDYLVSEVNKRYNVYASLARLPPTGPYCDKVSFDLDAKATNGLEELSEPERFEVMREDPQVAAEVLGDAVDDMRQLAAAAERDGIPAVGVFSGMGIHVHYLYQEAQEPRNEMLSTANRYVSELGLETVDQQPVGDVMRIMKIPNTQRRDAGTPCALWTVPMTRDEMQMADTQTLLEYSAQPRTPPLSLGERPQMEVYEDYLEQMGSVAPQREVAERASVTDETAEIIVRELIPMPCIRERVLSRRPAHHVRQNFAVWLFNLGFSIQESHDIIRGLNWENYDAEETDKQLRQIWRKRYYDWSCRRLKSKGYCVRLDNPRECETYGWSGGNQRYP